MSFHPTLAGGASAALAAGAGDTLAAGADATAGAAAALGAALGAGTVAAGCAPPHDNKTAGPKQPTNITIQPFDLRFINHASFPSTEGAAQLWTIDAGSQMILALGQAVYRRIGRQLRRANIANGRAIRAPSWPAEESSTSNPLKLSWTR